MTTCSLCGLPLTVPLIWRGRVRSMEEGPCSAAQPHLCPAPDLPPPNERYFRQMPKASPRKERARYKPDAV
jgi:hypothetical protein